MNMNDEMAAIAKRLTNQDNACTAHPLFLVQQRERIYGFDPAYSNGDDVVWLYEGEELDTAEAAKAESIYDESGDEPEGHTRTCYIDRWEFVTCCLTREAAETFIRANAHNLKHPRVYVESAYRNYELITVREHLLELARRGAA